MVRLFGCDRSKNAHIERKKSKMTFVVDHKPTRQEEKEIETEMNRLIELDMPVTYEFVDRDHIPANVKLDRLPDDASETLRLVRIGDYDVCPCIGKHVRSTAQIGKFVLLGTNWDEHAHSLRIRFKIVQYPTHSSLLRMAPWIAAPTATTSSGLTPLEGSLPK